MNTLDLLGWTSELQQTWTEMELGQCVPGRVIADYGSVVKVAIPNEINAEVSGRLQYYLGQHEMPKVGDWVAVQPLDDEHGLIHGVIPRSSEIGRKQPGEKTEKQVLAANVDIAFLVQALDDDFSPNRLQRYLFQLHQEGVEPIIVLNKADKEADLENKLTKLDQFNVRIIISSATQDKGITEIAKAIPPGKTAVFLGSSGVGRSETSSYSVDP
jgi:ribosome biogenesis GTPase